MFKVYEYNVPLCNGTHCIQNVHPSYSNGNKRVLTVIVVVVYEFQWDISPVLFFVLCKPPGVKTFCDATEPHNTTQCFGSLGGTVEVLLPTRTSQDDIYRLKENNYQIVEYKSQTKNVDYSFNVSTGIFTINDVNRTEDDTYSIEAQNRNGINLSNIQFHLSIQGE